mmetsp:Transcript_15606/g.25853  ORF Transcript_15606/g.25853 Transcript_15606/m.25853 type:complete len:411 (-) Transcript_15606:185-1417(-)
MPPSPPTFNATTLSPTDILPAQWAFETLKIDDKQVKNAPPPPSKPVASKPRPTVEELKRSPSFWYGPDIAKRPQDWTRYLTSDEVAEIRSAIDFAKKKYSHLSIEEIIPIIRKEDFPLPKFAGEIEKIYQKVVNGNGFFLLEGLPVREWSIPDISLAYFGIGSYIGEAVSQNAMGHILGHVKDVGGDASNPATRIYRTREKQFFHADACDIVGLLTLRTAKEGGLSSLASSYAVYYEILRQRPDLLAVLESDDNYWDRKNEVPPGKEKFFKGPVFNWFKGRLCSHNDPTFTHAAQRHPEVPRMSDVQKEAFDFLEKTCLRDDVRVDMELKEGDIQFVHNPHIFHARSRYVDHDKFEDRRHLLRLWLSNPRGIELPDSTFAEWYNGPVTVGKRRGGIYMDGMKIKAPLEAE